MFTTGTIKKFMPPETVYRLNANPIKIPITFFHRNRKDDPKLHLETTRKNQ